MYFLLHKVQLHVSALDNGHFQVVHEIFSKQLYYIYYVLYEVVVGGEVGTISRMCLEVGRCGYRVALLRYIMSMLIQLPYYVCRNYTYMYAYPNIYTVCNIVQNVVSIV